MLNGREKNGDLNINWKEYALGANHFKRKTVGFGKYDKREKEYEKAIHIREMSIIQGGIGCAIWDAAIIFSRWVYKNTQVFDGQKVLELGSGVGLPGILASYYAAHVTLSDYLPPLIENLQYNVDLNAKQKNDGSDDEEEDEQEQEEGTTEQKIDIRNRIDIKLLNWDEIDNIEVKEEDKYDIIFGSELTYNDGMFYEILSDDRDGVSYFIEKMTQLEFASHIVPVPSHFLGSYGTKQREETYKFYSFYYSKNQNIVHPFCQ
ncbi:hypothetical protein DFA_11909 [Cavenderia fasciculata]|uniref:Methyltransferase n=1 Tax=Cavenderia fasciculata TaxID=261658 RepID=F4QEN1_CACFS|nr:uncharacterized protein DFA_11909 [Cavenderia fasciculata]EGG14142.1 hypothetical protein DFA_11909 [Cavenderia fasciculata]|eukprot:XP_004350850.1 hypothetical protein DFA_11909 [Cavenderia fasciculata]